MCKWIPGWFSIKVYTLTKYVNLLRDYFHATFIVYKHFQKLDRNLLFSKLLNDLLVTGQINKNVSFLWFVKTLTYIYSYSIYLLDVPRQQR